MNIKKIKTKEKDIKNKKPNKGVKKLKTMSCNLKIL